MGMTIEVNTMLRLGRDDPKVKYLKIGEAFSIKKPNIRLYLIDIPILLISEDWTVLGYCVVKKTVMKGSGMDLEVELVSKFTSDESKIHTKRLKEALKRSKYLK